MHSVIYREVVIIDGREYAVSTCDFSEFIQSLIEGKEIPDDVDNHTIFDYVLEETPLRK